MTDATRPPAVAGAFYPDDANELTALLEACFRSPRGPGHLPGPRRTTERRIRAAVVPHAGYVYSGPIAARAYAAIAAERPPASVLVLGVNHHGRGAPAALSNVDWTTPLGPVRVDRELVRALARGPIEIDEEAHAPEHSIEVQLPFLQYVHPHPRFAALSVTFGPRGFLADVAAVVQRAVRDRDVLLLASTDFSHYVRPEEAKELDRLAIDEILARRPEGLYDTVVGKDISMCGIAPTTTLLAALDGEELTTEPLGWGHSGEAEPMDRVVGYASVLLRATEPLAASA
jgi:AmmeMemoRadiSam system protein B